MDGTVVHRHFDHIRSGIPLSSGGELNKNNNDDFDIAPSIELSTNEPSADATSADTTTDSVGDQPQLR